MAGANQNPLWHGMNLDEINYRIIGPGLALFSDESLEKIRVFNETIIRQNLPSENGLFYRVLTHDLEVVNFELWRRNHESVMVELQFRTNSHEQKSYTKLAKIFNKGPSRRSGPPSGRSL
ncbi:uncharacterized protein LOC126748373 [Anthonomus grandis grandis]|uniref:uncharacterized protein LOC126748373 n=1 Tax=Anthonomus grandis grandis TaxID=2921223 RepID=UPI002166B641|nr:uncharacterized protein LOC126748373 [Anthonomus grandis grandis]